MSRLPNHGGGGDGPSPTGSSGAPGGYHLTHADQHQLEQQLVDRAFRDRAQHAAFLQGQAQDQQRHMQQHQHQHQQQQQYQPYPFLPMSSSSPSGPSGYPAMTGGAPPGSSSGPGPAQHLFYPPPSPAAAAASDGGTSHAQGPMSALYNLSGTPNASLPSSSAPSRQQSASALLGAINSGSGSSPYPPSSSIAQQQQHLYQRGSGGPSSFSGPGSQSAGSLQALLTSAAKGRRTPSVGGPAAPATAALMGGGPAGGSSGAQPNPLLALMFQTPSSSDVFAAAAPSQQQQQGQQQQAPRARVPPAPLPLAGTGGSSSHGKHSTSPVGSTTDSPTAAQQSLLRALSMGSTSSSPVPTRTEFPHQASPTSDTGPLASPTPLSRSQQQRQQQQQQQPARASSTTSTTGSVAASKPQKPATPTAPAAKPAYTYVNPFHLLEAAAADAADNHGQHQFEDAEDHSVSSSSHPDHQKQQQEAGHHLDRAFALAASTDANGAFGMGRSDQAAGAAPSPAAAAAAAPVVTKAKGTKRTKSPKRTGKSPTTAPAPQSQAQQPARQQQQQQQQQRAEIARRMSATELLMLDDPFEVAGMQTMSPTRRISSTGTPSTGQSRGGAAALGGPIAEAVNSEEDIWDLSVLPAPKAQQQQQQQQQSAATPTPSKQQQKVGDLVFPAGVVAAPILANLGGQPEPTTPKSATSASSSSVPSVYQFKLAKSVESSKLYVGPGQPAVSLFFDVHLKSLPAVTFPNFTLITAGTGDAADAVLPRGSGDVAPAEPIGPAPVGLVALASDECMAAYIGADGHVHVVDVVARTPLAVLEDDSSTEASSQSAATNQGQSGSNRGASATAASRRGGAGTSAAPRSPRPVVDVALRPQFLALAHNDAVSVYRVRAESGTVERTGELKVFDASGALAQITRVVLLGNNTVVAACVASGVSYVVMQDAVSVVGVCSVSLSNPAVAVAVAGAEAVAHLVPASLPHYFWTATRSGDIKLWTGLAVVRAIPLGGTTAGAPIVGVQSIGHSEVELGLVVALPSTLLIISATRASSRSSNSVASVVASAAFPKVNFTRIMATASGNGVVGAANAAAAAATAGKASRNSPLGGTIWLQTAAPAPNAQSLSNLAGAIPAATTSVPGPRNAAAGVIAVTLCAGGNPRPHRVAKLALPSLEQCDELVGWSIVGDTAVAATSAGLYAGALSQLAAVLADPRLHRGAIHCRTPADSLLTVPVLAGKAAAAVGSNATASRDDTAAGGVARGASMATLLSSPPSPEPVATVVIPATKAESVTGRGSQSARATPTTAQPSAAAPVPAADAAVSESMLSRLLDGKLAAQAAKYEAAIERRAAAEQDRQEELLKVVAATLTNNVAATLDSLVSSHVQSMVVPVVREMVAKALADDARHRSMELARIATDTAAACQRAVVEQLVPAYERATGEMLAQVARAVDAGVQQVVVGLDARVSSLSLFRQQQQQQQQQQIQQRASAAADEWDYRPPAREDVDDDDVADTAADFGSPDTRPVAAAITSGDDDFEDEDVGTANGLQAIVVDDDEDEEEEEEEEEARLQSQQLGGPLDTNSQGQDDDDQDEEEDDDQEGGYAPTSSASLETQIGACLNADNLDGAFRLAMSSDNALAATDWLVQHLLPPPPSSHLVTALSPTILLSLVATLCHQLPAVVHDASTMHARTQWLTPVIQALYPQLPFPDPEVAAPALGYLQGALEEVKAAETVLMKEHARGVRLPSLAHVKPILRGLTLCVQTLSQ
ncbi:hypothetical protein BC828DRAFT_406512 [Blastocladiella britannica]|nr:hypothetical protein BC828DRAFT_406512 [Blastocladiella britannica]